VTEWRDILDSLGPNYSSGHGKTLSKVTFRVYLVLFSLYVRAYISLLLFVELTQRVENQIGVAGRLDANRKSFGRLL
jgi:hypothetical protein